MRADAMRRNLNRGPFSLVAPVLTVLTCLFLIVPIGMSILAGVTENYFIGVRSGLTLRWVGEVWATGFETPEDGGGGAPVQLLIHDGAGQ